jgi:hypothetical protein
VIEIWGDPNTVNGELGIELKVVFGDVDWGMTVGLRFTVESHFRGVNNAVGTDSLTEEFEGEFNCPDEVIDPLLVRLSPIEVVVGLPDSRDGEWSNIKSKGSCEESGTTDDLNPRTNKVMSLSIS